MGKMFGTDGVRGIANAELTAELAYKLGKAGAFVLASESHRPKIVVGMDTRISGDMLESAIVSGILSAGAEAICAGIVPTPAVAYLTRKYKADAGIVISASHNPVEYNGIKFFNEKGYKLPDEVEDRIEELVLNNCQGLPSPTGSDLGRKITVDCAARDYEEFLKSTVDVDFRGIKVAVDCAQGASYAIAPKVLSDLGAEVLAIYNNPDGKNINKECGSTHPNHLQKFVVENSCHLGLAFDGDADRLIAVDEKGNIVNGDFIMAICADYLKEAKKLKDDTVVVTVMSNLGLDIAFKERSIKSLKTKVGDRYVLEEMLKGGYSIGGEQSGHIIFLDYNTTGDGILTALQLMMVMKKKNKSLSSLSSIMTELPQVLCNAKVNNDKKAAYNTDKIILSEIQKIEDKLNGIGRVLIRPSGTEPLVRVMLEGKNKIEIELLARSLAYLIEERCS
ncbi:phosphoglucosamine mutase [Oxobacter pfennigii]|uniref:Phosphoglucosamine mutase n=1 Tax=Oxobacter pfennigii TaxID=36849 RepID=A0A0P8X5X4_9CLOT|nr:phosphoglucosamine mutase [Oxobacter pfennigii]KPU46313.1 phosphoglucosamine mutase [Oxobacter pfennigii]